MTFNLNGDSNSCALNGLIMVINFTKAKAAARPRLESRGKISPNAWIFITTSGMSSAVASIQTRILLMNENNTNNKMSDMQSDVRSGVVAYSHISLVFTSTTIISPLMQGFAKEVMVKIMFFVTSEIILDVKYSLSSRSNETYTGRAAFIPMDKRLLYFCCCLIF